MKKYSANNIYTKKRCDGFTLIELLVVITISAILLAMAIPTFNDWRQNLSYRQSGREVMSMLRKAKGIAISTNRQQQIVLDGLLNGTYRNYRLQSGNRAVLSTVWQPSDTTILPTGVGIQAQGSINGVLTPTQTMIIVNPVGSIQFTGNPAPASTDLSMNLNILQDNSAILKYKINVTQTGRIAGSRE